MNLLIFAVSLCIANGASVGLTPDDFLITSLPSLSANVPFKQYAGQMPLGDADETALFFWFVESARDPVNDPVCLWLNGGPGSSSVMFGFWTEHGPFRIQRNGSVNLYSYSWNRIANVVYLESPSGVGLSYSNKSSGYNCTDEKSAEINFMFLEQFFKVFTQFTKNDFYITGESYGGHYVPQLAEKLIDNPNTINMKGFLVGNPGINSDWYFNINEYAFQTFLWSHALLPQTAYLKSKIACDWDQFLTNCSRDFTHPTAACQAANQAAYKYVPKVWDPYDIFAPTCHIAEEDRLSGDDFVKEYTPFLHSLRKKYNIDTTYDPCLSRYVPRYMNRPDVLQALHAVSYHGPYPSHPRGWTYGSELADIALLFPKFFTKRPTWKIAVISGDADSAVPFVGSERWIECLNKDTKQDWQNWMLNKDVAGSFKVYDGISFVTVKGCGHTIPTYCPEAGFAFFNNWLEGMY